jgi:hypothetical protein
MVYVTVSVTVVSDERAPERLIIPEKRTLDRVRGHSRTIGSGAHGFDRKR